MEEKLQQLYRDEFAHYIKTSDVEENWVLEGIGVDSLAIAYNPQIDQYKTIIDRNANATFSNYQLQASVSGKRIYKGDAIYEYLNTARKQLKAIETEILEVELASGNEFEYEATKYNCLIVIDEFLGENATISYSIYITGTPVYGTADITDNTIHFVEKAD